jgi:hypothetical protein
MSTSEVERILAKLEGVGERVASLEATVGNLDAKVDKYNGLKDRMFQIEGEHKVCVAVVEHIKSNCQAIQGAKKEKRIKWEVIYPSIVSTVVAALVLYLLLGK